MAVQITAREKRWVSRFLVLWETYGDEITAMMQAASTTQPNERQIALDFNDQPDF